MFLRYAIVFILIPVWGAVLLTCAVSADATRHTLHSYQDLEAAIAAFDPATTLLVFDNDDTVSTMPCLTEETCQYLGGAAWFDWQDELRAHPSPYRVAETFPGLLAVSNFIFNATDMQVTDPALPALLERLVSRGMRLMVHTARGGETVNATERQLSALLMPSGGRVDLLTLVRGHAPRFKANGQAAALASLAGPFVPCGIAGARPVTYRQGVMYLSGQNKGVMLGCLLERYRVGGVAAAPAEGEAPAERPAPVRQIVFVDDTPGNVDKVVAAFQDHAGITVKAFHYTGLDARKAALTSGADAKRLQDRAKARFDAIKGALGGALVRPSFE